MLYGVNPREVISDPYLHVPNETLKYSVSTITDNAAKKVLVDIISSKNRQNATAVIEKMHADLIKFAAESGENNDAEFSKLIDHTTKALDQHQKLLKNKSNDYQIEVSIRYLSSTILSAKSYILKVTCLKKMLQYANTLILDVPEGYQEQVTEKANEIYNIAEKNLEINDSRKILSASAQNVHYKWFEKELATAYQNVLQGRGNIPFINDLPPLDQI